MITLRDVAKACGCSVTSASRALKNSRSISLDLRERAHKAAKELGYIPNNVAESMRTGKTNTIAIIIQETMNPYYSFVIHSLEGAVSQKGFSLIMLTGGQQSTREVDAVYTALGKKVDGILLYPAQQDMESLEILKRSRIPYVLLGRFFDAVKSDCVLPDDEQGVYLTTKHLIERGHKRIMMINSFKHISSSKLRENGYRRAMAEAGHTVRKGDVFHISSDKGDCAELVRRVFSGKHDYSAICCYNDVIGYEAVYALRQLGLDVPGKIAVTGVDDLHSYVSFPIRLTSAGYDIPGLARIGFDLLLEKISFQKKRKTEVGEWLPRGIRLDQYLVVGETT